MNKMLVTILIFGAYGLSAVAKQETYSCNLTQKVNDPIIGGGGVLLEVTADSNVGAQVQKKVWVDLKLKFTPLMVKSRRSRW